jgi:hypothetical protein
MQLQDVIGLHRQQDVGVLDVAVVQAVRPVRAQVDPVPSRTLDRGGVGRAIRSRVEPGGPDPHRRPSEAARAHQLGRERAADDVPVTDEDNGPRLADARGELPGLTRRSPHALVLVRAREPSLHFPPEFADHLAEPSSAWLYSWQ